MDQHRRVKGDYSRWSFYRLNSRNFFLPFLFLPIPFCAFSQSEDYSKWPYSQKIFINTDSTGADIKENLFRFPLLVRLNPTTFSGFANTLPMGTDIRFSKSDGTSHLSYEIERWVDDPQTGGDTAEIWVQMDTIYGNNNKQYIMMYYGGSSVLSQSNGSAVFDTADGFQAVWHLTDTSDATQNRYKGSSPSKPATAAGVVGIGKQFNGTSDYLKITDSVNSKLNFPWHGVYTLSAWINVNDTTHWHAVVGKGDYQYSLKLHAADPAKTSWEFSEYTNNVGGKGVWKYVKAPVAGTLNRWTYISLVQGADTTLYFYLNGALISKNDSFAFANENYPRTDLAVCIGRLSDFSAAGGGYRYFAGKIDEVNMANTERSADWVKLSYETQKSGSTCMHLCEPPSIKTYPQPQTAAAPAPATFTVVAAGTPPLSYQWQRADPGSVTFNNTTNGIGGATASYTTGPTSVTADSGARYRCVVTNVGGAAVSAAAMLRVWKSPQIFNPPVVVRGIYHDSVSVNLTIRRFSSLPEKQSDPSFFWTADSVLVWYKRNAFPANPPSRTDPHFAFSVASLKAGGTDTFSTRVSVPFVESATHYSYSFLGSVLWDSVPASTGTYSIPFFADTSTGVTIYMSDDTIANPLIFSFQCDTTTKNDSVRVTLAKLSLLEWDRIDKLLLGYQLPNCAPVIDTIPKMALNPVLDVFSKVYHDPRFVGERQEVLWKVTFIPAIATAASAAATAACWVGVSRPDNPLALHAGVVHATSVELIWNRPPAWVEGVRIWYATKPVPLTNTFSPSEFLSASSQGNDTQLTVIGLKPETAYHFGAQVKRWGIWSDVKAAATVMVKMSSLSDSIPIKNTIVFEKLLFDSITNKITFLWTIDTTGTGWGPGVPLEAGISWKSDSGAAYVEPNPPLEGVTGLFIAETQWGSTLAHILAISTTNLEFGGDYYFGFWLRKADGKWSAPTPQSSRKLHIPRSWETVVCFPPGVSVVYSLDSMVLFKKCCPGGSGLKITGKLCLTHLPVEKSGCIAVSPAVLLDLPLSAPPEPLSIGLRYNPNLLPVGTSAGDIRFYHYDSARAVWLVDMQPLHIDSGGIISIMKNASDCRYPFTLMIDPQEPRVLKMSDTASILRVGEPIVFSYTVQDNIANVKTSLSYGRGNDAVPLHHDTTSGNYIDSASWTIPGTMMTGDVGMRAYLVVSDGRFTKTIDVSRNVVRSGSDPVTLKYESWIPLGSTAVLDKPGVIDALAMLFLNDNNQNVYDQTRFRLFRFMGREWMEYADTQKNQFSFLPGRVFWIKSRETWTINLGSGSTVPLKNPYALPLAVGGWTDFCLPYPFEIYIGDVLDSTGNDAIPLLFCEWGRNDAKKTYTLSKVFDPSNPGDPILNNKKFELKYKNGENTAYSVFNPANREVLLRIPPVPKAMSHSTIAAAPTTRGNWWTITVHPSPEKDAINWSPVYCGYYNTEACDITGYPIPPSWSTVKVGIRNPEGPQCYGGVVTHSLSKGGYAYYLEFINKKEPAVRIRYAVDRRTCAPDDLMTAIVDPMSATQEQPDTGGVYSVDVAGNGKVYRWLVAGSREYVTGFKSTLYHGEFKVARLVPNPFHGILKIEFFVPPQGFSALRCEAIDFRGRVLWSRTERKNLRAGRNFVVWNGKGSANASAAAGVYIVRLTGFDEEGAIAGLKQYRVTYLP